MSPVEKKHDFDLTVVSRATAPCVAEGPYIC